MSAAIENNRENTVKNENKQNRTKDEVKKKCFSDNNRTESSANIKNTIIKVKSAIPRRR